jgi:cellulose synthase/poly-beta-1,6-N-acetylglucosamine synthase-like glycosyltransferase
MEFSTIHWVALVLFVLALLVQSFYYLFFYRKLIKQIITPEIKPEICIPVSIIVAARNEAQRLECLLPVLLHQDYDDYEVVIVDDRSTDGTSILINKLSEKYKFLKYIRIEEGETNNHGKKYALTKGIEYAANDCLLFTDADCIPVSDMWVSRMLSQFKTQNTIILGYGGYFNENTFVNDMLRYDTSFIAMQYGSFALSGLPYMGVGRNLMYSKQLWKRGNAYSKHIDFASGDDDLFVQSHLQDAEFRVQFHAEAITRSLPPDSFKKWRNQKIRHYSVANQYPLKIKMLLVLEPLSRVLLLISFILAVILFTGKVLLSIVIAFLVFYTLKFLIFGSFLKRMSEYGLYKNLLLFDFILPCVQTYFYLCSLFSSRNIIWK